MTMPNTWKPLGEIVNDLHWAENKKKAVKWDGNKWRPVPCPQDEGQYEAVARRRDAREGHGDE